MSFDQLPIPGPFKGIVDNQPRPTKPVNAWDDLYNFFPYQGRLISRPRLNPWGNPPDSAIVRLMYAYSDLLGNFHNLVLTTQTAYAVTEGPVYNPLTLPQGVVNLAGTSLPYGYAVMLGRVYFSNGSVTALYTDGSGVTGDPHHPGAWRFCAVLGNHLISANTTEPAPYAVGSTRFQNRVRWSNSGDPNSWQPGAGSTAGFNDLLEVPDQITGLNTLGRSGYVWRNNGVTLMTPTGVGASPFQFDQITNAPVGVGCWYPYSLATYGDICCFVSSAEIYAFDGSSFSAIGAEAKNKIFGDILNTPVDSIYGWIIPRIGAGFPFLSYWLSLPASSNGTPVTWVYSFDDKAWMRFASGYGQLTALANLWVA